MLPKWPLFTGAEGKHRDRVLGEVEKTFYCFARQRASQHANALKTVRSSCRGVVRSCTVFTEQGVSSLGMISGWQQGEVSSIFSLLVSASLGFTFLPGDWETSDLLCCRMTI